jgi:hypothetical protein
MVFPTVMAPHQQVVDQILENLISAQTMSLLLSTQDFTTTNLSRQPAGSTVV